jgi:hypothetical protein
LARLVVGSTLAGTDTPESEFEELSLLWRSPFWMTATDFAVKVYYGVTSGQVARGPITPEEEQMRLDALAKRKAERESTTSTEGGGGQMMLVGGTSQCITNVPVFITNLVAAFASNQGWTATFDIQGGTNGLLYDVFTTTNLIGNSITNSQWTWLELGPTCSTYQYTNQPDAYAFYVLGTPQDSDADGLTDAYEALASKTGMQSADTDGDGLSDWYELNVSHTSPLLAEPVPSLASHPVNNCPIP